MNQFSDIIGITNALAYCARMLGRTDHNYDIESHELWMWYHAGMYALRAALVDALYAQHHRISN
jgi:hypothetical protein